MRKLTLLFAALAFVSVCPLRADEPLADAITRAKLDATEQLKRSTTELVAVRARIAAERKPLAEATRVAESRIAELESDIARLETDHANMSDTRQRLLHATQTDKRSLGYLVSQSQEGLKAMEESLLPGEHALWSDRLAELRRSAEKATPAESVPLAMAAAELELARLERQVGGYAAAGQAVDASDNRILAGEFLFVGPEVFFRAKSEPLVGTVELRPGSDLPGVRVVAGWTPAAAGTLFDGGRGVAPLDASGGKALALKMRTGSVLDQLRKGGVVGYAIIVIGVLALAIAIQKLFDFCRLAVDEPPAVRAVLARIAAGEYDEAARAAQSLKTTTRELFAIGLKHRSKPKAILEEHLESYVLQQRMLQERRLPLLAVIATSGPLLGLLGTVTGMIKTFTLITVFGTGSAGKLSAGISEALVATKLGLMVAIPALVVHGFLSHRIQKHLSMLERYALEISTANEESRQVRRERTEVR
jgi:biopolymer transport protein ExbB